MGQPGIVHVETVESNLRITLANWTKWRDRENDLPEIHPLHGINFQHQEVFVGDPRDNGWECTAVDFRWSGTWSGRAYEHILAEFAADLLGTGEFFLTWDDGGISAIRIHDGVVTVHRVVMAHGAVIETLPIPQDTLG